MRDRSLIANIISVENIRSGLVPVVALFAITNGNVAVASVISSVAVV